MCMKLGGENCMATWVNQRLFLQSDMQSASSLTSYVFEWNDLHCMHMSSRTAACGLHIIFHTQLRWNPVKQTHHTFCPLKAADFGCAPFVAVMLADTCNLMCIACAGAQTQPSSIWSWLSNSYSSSHTAQLQASIQVLRWHRQPKPVRHDTMLLGCTKLMLHLPRALKRLGRSASSNSLDRAY